MVRPSTANIDLGVRWLGDREGIEKQTTTWDKTVIDRTSDLKNWVEVFQSLVSNTQSLKNFRLQQQPLCGAWARDGQTVHGLVERETIELRFGAQLALDSVLVTVPFNRAGPELYANAKAVSRFWQTINHFSDLRKFPC